MSELEDVASYIFMWNSLSDACPTCASLNGQDFRDQDIYQEVLWSPIWGNIWNLNADHSMAHGGAQHNCRCQLTVRVEFDWNKWSVIKELREANSLF
jgi:hypothetical protein